MDSPTYTTPNINDNGTYAEALANFTNILIRNGRKEYTTTNSKQAAHLMKCSKSVIKISLL